MQVLSKSNNCVTLQIGGDQVVFFNKYGVAWEAMLDEALSGKKGPKWKRVEFCDATPESLVAEFLLTAGATRHHDGRNYVYNFANLQVGEQIVKNG